MKAINRPERWSSRRRKQDLRNKVAGDFFALTSKGEINILKFQRGDENFVANVTLNVNYFKVGNNHFQGGDKP